MKQALLLSVLSIGLLSSCATAFKTGQTPDDVYFSPGREVTVAEEVVPEKEKQQYQEYISSMDDRYLRMKVANRYRWGAIDNYDYWYDSRYDFNAYNHSYYNALNPYNSWNPYLSLRYGYGAIPGYYGYGYGYGWNSPVYTLIGYKNPTIINKGYTAGSSITAFRNRSYNNSNYGYKDPKTGAFVPSGSNNSFGSLVKRIFTGSSSTNNNTSYDRPQRTFQPSNTNTNTAPATSSSAGGNSGGFKSTGSSTSTGRGGKG
ncbi:MAG: hypothetical protein V4450_16520 [Bacteroidota bacterium]